MIKAIYSLSVFFVFCSFSSWSSTLECPELNSPEAVVQCALLKHPDLKVSEAGIQQSLMLERFARQRPNPEFDMTSTYGKSLGDNITTVEANLGFVLELGGKRRARIQQAWAQQSEASAEMLKTKEDVYITTMASLIRLRQLDTEIEALEHALSEFGRIQGLYRAYGRLSPEQQISLNIFQLAQGAYRATKAAAQIEQQRYLRGLQLSLGQEIKLKASLYPKPLKDWPRLQINDELGGSGIQHAEADIKLAEADVKAEQANVWPTVKVGPSMSQQSEGPFSYQMYGFNVSLPIPFFHLNQGGRAFANAGLARSQANLHATKSKLLTEKSVLINQYNSFIETLRQLPSVESIEQKHKGAEDYFRRGLLSTSLMVEYHRQIVDFIVSQNELELAAIQSLWQVYAIEGRIFPKTNSVNQEN